MYHGEVNVDQEDLQLFLAAAEELRIKGLSQVKSSEYQRLDSSESRNRTGSSESKDSLVQ